MTRGVRLYLVGSLVLVALAGCGRVWVAEREAWRREAEVACLKSGAIKEGAGIVQSRPIQGPGVCGADHPFKVSALGEPTAALGYTHELRPPGAIPGQHPLAAPPPPSGSYPTRSVHQGPASYPSQQPYPAQQPYPSQQPYPARQTYPAQQPYPAAQRPSYGQSDTYPNGGYRPGGASQSSGPMSINPPGVEPEDYDEPGDLVDAPDPREPAPAQPRGYPSSVPAQRPVYGAQPSYQPSYPARPNTVPLSPSRVPAPAAAMVEIKPSATLACPIVSQLDQWLASGVQPAAMRWFGQPVAEIKQISAYSCRSMNGQSGGPISEHAFGNALDIASFTLADGRKVTVKDGWRGLPEEQGFLRDVHASACDRFSTVLAPGSNVFHYDHIHVDLARRNSGRRICNPAAVPGDVVAGRAGHGTAQAARRDDPYTGSIGRRSTRPQRWNERDERYDSKLPHARAGED